RFLETIGTADRMAFQPRLHVPFNEPGRGVTSLECPDWPAPWHLVLGVLASASFAAGEKLELARLGRWLSSAHGLDAPASPRLSRPEESSERGSGLTVARWWRRLGQCAAACRTLGALVCMA